MKETHEEDSSVLAMSSDVVNGPSDDVSFDDWRCSRRWRDKRGGMEVGDIFEDVSGWEEIGEGSGEQRGRDQYHVS